MELIVSHDAGGAELISCWIKYNKKKNFLFCLDGPAKKIFKKNIGHYKNILFKNIKNYKFEKIITGTSWDSDIEKKAIIFGKNKKIYTISYLDNWNNYLERFTFKEKLILPNEINVVDKYAYNLAKKKFKNIKIKKKINFYQKNLLNKFKFKKAKNNSKIKILYLSEPIFDHGKKQYGNGMYWGYDEFVLLEKFFNNVSKLTKKKFVILFRHHPSEKKEKYTNLLKKYSKIFNLQISKKINLLDDITRSDIVVGNQSMAMAMAVAVNKMTFSILPNLKHKVLPHKKIKYI